MKILLYLQGAHDHIERLEMQVPSSGALEPQRLKALNNSELARMRAELADARGSVSQLQRRLQEEHAEVLMLKESQGGSNKASDVIQALESQVAVMLCKTEGTSAAHSFLGSITAATVESRQGLTQASAD